MIGFHKSAPFIGRASVASDSMPAILNTYATGSSGGFYNHFRGARNNPWEESCRYEHETNCIHRLMISITLSQPLLTA